jgi:hypothetical protein
MNDPCCVSFNTLPVSLLSLHLCLTPWTRVLLEKLIFDQTFKNSVEFYGTRRIIIFHTNPAALPHIVSEESVPLFSIKVKKCKVKLSL